MAKAISHPTAEYVDQMRHPNYYTWHCPRCRGFASWDDDNYERALNAMGPEPRE